MREIAKVRDEFEASGLGRRLARYHRDPAATFDSWADVWLSDAFLQWNIEAEVAAIDCPLLAIQGEDDQYGTPQQIERLLRLSPHAKAMMLPDCRHSPHAEQPDVVLAALTGFVAGSGALRRPPRSPARSSCTAVGPGIDGVNPGGGAAAMPFFPDYTLAGNEVRTPQEEMEMAMQRKRRDKTNRSWQVAMAASLCRRGHARRGAEPRSRSASWRN